MKTLLIVDDDDDVRGTLAELLGDEGYPVLEARNGAEALARLRAPGPAPALILLDMMMPVMDGRTFRLAQLADPALAGIPVVILSADMAMHVKAADLLASAILRKPIGLAQLLAVAAQYCGEPT
jgi:CheY-like chemotaxis protein